MELGFVIAIVFLAIGLGFAAFVISYKSIVLDPLAEEQMIEFEQMSCDELKDYADPMWSPQNSLWLRTQLKICAQQ